MCHFIAERFQRPLPLISFAPRMIKTPTFIRGFRSNPFCISMLSNMDIQNGHFIQNDKQLYIHVIQTV